MRQGEGSNNIDAGSSTKIRFFLLKIKCYDHHGKLETSATAPEAVNLFPDPVDDGPNQDLSLPRSVYVTPRPDRR
jgi:hypothetical protein